MEGEKIIASIRAESQEKIKEIQEEAEKFYQEKIEKAKAKATEIKNGAELKLERQSASMISSYKSRAELERRNMILKTKREEIQKAIVSLHEYLLNAETKEYFEMILKLASSLGKMTGTFFFNARDLKRLPEGFSKKLSAEISKQPVNIDGGFILKNGDIEENMSFAAIIADKKEMLEDIISKELFRD